MIRWLVQSQTADVVLEPGTVPPGLLNDTEIQWLSTISGETRRSDWLLGRWTAKHLVQSYLAETFGLSALLEDLTIVDDEFGAPYVVGPPHLVAEGSHSPTTDIDRFDPGESESRVPLSLSISHSNGHAFCAISDTMDATSTSSMIPQVGVDIEKVRSRDLRFAQDYYTSDEIRQINVAPTALRDLVVTAILSAKEATLKALRFDLQVNTRAVNCRVEQVEPQGWQPLAIELRGTLAGTAYIQSGWWRTLQDAQMGSSFVLTLVVASQTG